MPHEAPSVREVITLAVAFNTRAGNAIFRDDQIADRLFLSADEDKLNLDFMIKHFMAADLAKTAAGRDSDAYRELVIDMAEPLAAVLDQYASDALVIQAVPIALQKPDLAPAFAAQGAPQLAKLVARFH